jgi:hypothetical protein
MALRVLDDDPGFAILDFGRTLEAPKLEISVRNLSEPEKGYLWPDGGWRKDPHYFTAELNAKSEAGSAGYRVGPDMVNFLLEDTHIEVATRAGDLTERGYWQNAIPQLRSRGQSYTIGQPIATIEGKAPTAPPPRPPPPAPLAPPTPRPALAAPPSPPARPFSIARLWPLAALLLVIVLAAGALAFSPSLRCRLLGRGCPAEPTDEVYEEAMRCARDKLGFEPCAVDACFAAYRRGGRELKPEASYILAQAKAACAVSRSPEPLPRPVEKHPPGQALEAAYADAKACAEANPCVASACFETYLRLYGGSGQDRVRADADLAKARDRCAEQAPAVNLAAGDYNGFASAGCGAAGQPVTVTIGPKVICWRHDIPLVPGGQPVDHGWKGEIDSNGAIRATVPGLAGTSASGRYDAAGNEIQMRYPGCGGYVTLAIRQLRRRIDPSQACAAP